MEATPTTKSVKVAKLVPGQTEARYDVSPIKTLQSWNHPTLGHVVTVEYEDGMGFTRQADRRTKVLVR